MSEDKQITLTIDELSVVSSESIATNASASSLAKLFEGNVQSQLLNNQTAAATTAPLHHRACWACQGTR